MRKTNETIDFQKYMADRDIDSRIKASKDDVFRIMQYRYELLDTKIERLGDKIDNAVSSRKWIVGMFITILLAIAALAVPVVISLVN